MTMLFQDLEICLEWPENAADTAKRALRFAATLAKAQGATIRVRSGCEIQDVAFYCGAETFVDDPEEWASELPKKRFVLRNSDDLVGEIPQVFLKLAPWHSEATLFAASGLADLNGSPDGPPLVPNAHYAAHTIGYAAYTALIGVHALAKRFGKVDQAEVDGLAVLKWINWKAVAAGATGMEITRSGAMAEWPVLKCKDGHVAILFTERDWPAMIKMVGDPGLADPRFGSFQGREDHRAEYLPILKRWCETKNKAELREAMAQYEIPGDSVRTIADILDCELFAHRESFERNRGGALPRLPERVLKRTAQAQARPVRDAETGNLPLSGLRVLDLGIITAGAGVGAVLADMGAEVLKIESATHPDPFRQWAGSSESPLFRFNNRNKMGLDIDLKTGVGKAEFLELVEGADIVVENFRRGVIERLGLGFEALARANPAICLASISGQGNDGPGSHMSTFGSTLEANAGFAALTRDSNGQPYVTGRALNFPDQVICLYGAGLTAAAALQCRTSGRGMHLDISQRDTVLYQISDVIDWVSRGNCEEPSALAAGIGRPAVDHIFACADGAFVALQADDFSTLSDVFCVDEGSLAGWVRQQPSREVVEAFLAAGLGAAEAQTGLSLGKDRDLFSEGVFAKDPDGNVVKGFPFQLRQSQMSVRESAPAVGQHNARFKVSGSA